MKFKQETFYSILVTIGRKSGKEHAVELKAVFHDGKLYFSRRNSNSDWLKNAVANTHVKVIIDDKTLIGKASLVSDEELIRTISHLKYTDNRAEEARIVLEVILCE